MEDQKMHQDPALGIAGIVAAMVVAFLFIPEPNEAQQQPAKSAEQQKPGGQELLNQPKDVEEGFKPDPRFVVEPVPEPAEPTEAEMRKLVEEKKVKNVQFFKFGGWVKYTGDDRRIVLPAAVNMRRGLIEYFICAENSGKEHETVIEVACDPTQMVIAMDLLTMKKGPTPKTLNIGEAGQGERLAVLIQWKTGDGKTVTHRAEDFLIDTISGTTMPRVGWTYTGSYFTEYEDPDTREKKRFFVASAERRIISAFRDPSCILDSPMPEAARDQAIFDPNPSLIPKVGTPMYVIIRRLKEDERRAVETLEKSLAEKKKK